MLNSIQHVICPIAQGDMQKTEYFFPWQNMCIDVPNCWHFSFKSCYPLGNRRYLLIQAYMIRISTLYGKSDQQSILSFSQSPHYSFVISIVLGRGLAAEWSR